MSDPTHKVATTIVTIRVDTMLGVYRADTMIVGFRGSTGLDVILAVCDSYLKKRISDGCVGLSLSLENTSRVSNYIPRPICKVISSLAAAHYQIVISFPCLSRECHALCCHTTRACIAAHVGKNARTTHCDAPPLHPRVDSLILKFFRQPLSHSIFCEARATWSERQLG